ncbi:helix-turn-helix transcriptional regulator [bacterium]|nr:helix-turn-helix transcriptional regulator [bacterium]
MFNENLRILRKQKGMSQETLAQQLNVVRQTISKWEKGLSVPDADMLTQIAEFFEVSVSDLLGSKIEEEKNFNEIAMQLALLNEQLANRSRRRRKVFKVVTLTLAVIFLTSIMVCIGGTILYSPQPHSSATLTSVEMVCTLNDEEYIYNITYNDQYQIIESGGDAWIADHIQTEKISDANTLMAQIEDYFNDHGGTVEIK